MKVALRIAILYVFLSGIYILLSDVMVLRVAEGDPAVLAGWQALKGLAFVTMSGLIIFFLVLHYVRRRDRSERRLRELRDSFEKLFERTPVPIFAFDPVTGKFLAANEAAVQEYGHSREEFQNLTIEEIYPSEDQERLRAHLARIDHHPYFGRWRHQRRDGSIFPVETITHSVVLGGRNVRMAVAVNVTVRELTEQALAGAAAARREAEETRANLLSTISHEMRTPLRAILGGIDLIAEEADPVHREELIHLARNGARELSALIQQFLDASVLRSAPLDRQVEPIELEPFLRSLVEGISAEAASKDLELDLVLGENLPARAELDAPRLGQTLRILLGNAVKFSDQGRIELSARLLSQSHRDLLEITVSDEGIGVPAEKHEEVFQSFTQADQSCSRRHGGTGLGLFVARQLCDLAGATLGLTSEPGRGSTFTVRMPGILEGDRFLAGEPSPAPSPLVPAR